MQKLEEIRADEILREEFMLPMNISTKQLALGIDMREESITAIFAGAPINLDMDARLSRFFGIGKGYWLNLQREYLDRQNGGD